jgi:hypothetical protein
MTTDELVQVIRDQLVVVKESTADAIYNNEKYPDSKYPLRVGAVDEKVTRIELTDVVTPKGFSEEFIKETEPRFFDVLDGEGNVFQIGIERINWKDAGAPVPDEARNRRDERVEAAAVRFREFMANDQELLRLACEHATEVSGNDGSDEENEATHLAHYQAHEDFARLAFERAQRND